MKQCIFFFIAAICALPLHADEESTYNLLSYTHQANQYQPPYAQPRAALAAYEKTSSDRAKEQFRASCDTFSRKQRFSCPSYSIQNINAQLFASWSAADFARAAEYAIDNAHRVGSCRQDAEQYMLRQYYFYSIPTFLEYIKTFSDYRPHIKNLHARLAAQKPRCYCFFKALGLVDPKYVHKLDLAQKLYTEIAKEKLSEQKVAKQQQRQAALENQRRELQAQQAIRKKQESVHTTFEVQRDELNQLSDEWLCLQHIYQEHDLYDDGRYERRRQALYEVTHDACRYETKSYTVSPAASQLVGNMGNTAELYQTCYGNQLQQVIHQECIDGIERLVCLPEESVIYPYKKSLADCFDAAREYNQAGSADKATAVSDFCWVLLDYGKAIAQGAIDGVGGGVRDMLEHPIEMVACAVACEYVLAYQLSKILYNVADISITYAFDAEHGKKQWDEYTAPVTQLIDAISNKELSLRDGLKGATQFAVQWKTQAKLLGGLNKFCKTAKTRALEFAKNNPLVSPKQYMTTPEGIVLQSTQNIQPPPASGSCGPCLIKREQILQQVHTYEQARNKALEIIGEVDAHTVEPHIGKMGVCKGKITGLDWHDGKVTLRLDWDPVKEAHINVTDYRIGSGRIGKSIAIPFQGDENIIESLLKHLNSPASIDAAIDTLKKSKKTLKFDLLMKYLKEKT